MFRGRIISSAALTFTLVAAVLFSAGRLEAQTIFGEQITGEDSSISKPAWLLVPPEQKAGSTESLISHPGFTPFERHNARKNFGMIDGRLFLRFELRADRVSVHPDNTLFQSLKDISAGKHYVLVQSGLVDALRLYLFNQAGQLIKKVKTIPLMDKRVAYIALPGDEPVTALLEYTNSASLATDLTVMDMVSFQAAMQKEYLFFGAYFGVMLIMLFYNLFLAFSVRGRAYMYYVLYIAVITALMCGISGIIGMLSDQLAGNRATVLLGGAAVMASLAFTRQFLNTKENMPLLHLLTTAYIVIVALFTLFMAAGPLLVGNVVINWLVLGSNTLIMFTAFRGLYLKNRMARFFIIGWSFLVIGTTLSVLFFMGLLPKTFLVTRGIYWGSAVEVLFLSFAVADRINLMQSEKEEVLVRQVAAETRLNILEQELAVAQKIQRSILPGYTPHLPGMRIHVHYAPSEIIGGDFYDYHIIDRHRTGIFIADVTGHGIPASMVASMFKVLFSYQKENALYPDRVMAGINRAIYQMGPNSFGTACYLLVDLDEMTVRLSRAGHPPVLMWDDAAGRLEHLHPRGPLLGVYEDKAYPTLVHSISPGDRLLLYTDGVTECFDPAGRPFDEEGLERFIRENNRCGIHEMVQRLMAALELWKGPGREFDDDIAVIGLEVT